jgi:hypothetical protein
MYTMFRNSDLQVFYNEWGTGGMHIGYWWESQKERNQQEDQDVGGCKIIK